MQKTPRPLNGLSLEVLIAQALVAVPAVPAAADHAPPPASHDVAGSGSFEGTELVEDQVFLGRPCSRVTRHLLGLRGVQLGEGNAGTTTASFTVTGSGNTTGASSVKVRASGGTATAGTDYTALAITTVAFAAGETTKTVAVTVTADTTKEANETFNLVLSTPTGAIDSDASGTATIVDDD